MEEKYVREQNWENKMREQNDYLQNNYLHLLSSYVGKQTATYGSPLITVN